MLHLGESREEWMEATTVFTHSGRLNGRGKTGDLDQFFM